ncbi:unnamed protein product [Notodromas monacha]|uniref:Peroxisomal membrane protein 11B n=1 Tax=Notodromas monacha TaxID=399045 RepID=A0A7R9BIA1_9CRUS|nr:unnamed protein product [Notodromas monacha]CAG0914628.1 unnamed protein product [Notodromas monacha]
MDSYLKLSSSCAGRDKIFRFVERLASHEALSHVFSIALSRLLQYSSKFLGAALNNGRWSNEKAVNQIKLLESAMSLLRKGLRLGKSLDVLQGAVGTMRLRDPAVRTTTTVSRIQQALYLLADNVLWANRVGLVRLSNESKASWLDRCNRLWLCFLLANLARDLYEVKSIVRGRCELLDKAEPGLRVALCAPPTSLALVRHLVWNHGDVAVDLAKNLCDILIPLDALGYVRLPPGLVGICGAVSSALGLLAIVDPVYKLNPA